MTRLELLIDRIVRQRLATVRQRLVWFAVFLAAWTGGMSEWYQWRLDAVAREGARNNCLSIDALKAQRVDTILRARKQLRTNPDYRSLVTPKLARLAEEEYARQLLENAPDPTECRDPQPPPKVRRK